MSARRLRVSLSGLHVGTLLQNAEGRVQWLPDAAWEASGQKPRLGAEFLRHPGPRSGVPGLPHWFENLLPEADSELRHRLSALHGLRKGQSFRLLEALGSDLAGAVEVCSELDGEATVGDSADAEDEAHADPERLRAGGSTPMSALAGMQLKFSMSMVHDRLVLPAHGRGGEWIVKFAGPTYVGLPEVECATMDWATAAGFDVPEHRTVDVHELVGIADWVGDSAPKAFAIRRFDRLTSGDKVHQEDLCQALGLHPANKFGNFPRVVSFDGVLRFVTDLSGESMGREMARRMGFVIASGNSDAHLKNWSLLWNGSAQPVLTPCYDLVATVAWPTVLGWELEGGPSLALRLGREWRFERLKTSVLAELAKASAQPWAADEVMAGVLAARDAWRSVADSAPESMCRALDVHWASVPLLARVGR